WTSHTSATLVSLIWQTCGVTVALAVAEAGTVKLGPVSAKTVAVLVCGPVRLSVTSLKHVAVWPGPIRPQSQTLKSSAVFPGEPSQRSLFGGTTDTASGGAMLTTVQPSPTSPPPLFWSPSCTMNCRW